jgi:hypothetical protein
MQIVIFASLTEDTTANYLVRALKKLGNDTFVFSDIKSPLANKHINSCINVHHECSELGINPDLFLFIEGGSMKYFPKGLENLKCKTAWYGIDTHMDYRKHLAIGRLFDVSFIAQKEFTSQLLHDGLTNVYWLPLAFEQNLSCSFNSSKEYLISYVGSNNSNMHPLRYELIDAIKKNFNECFFGRATPLEMANIYSRSYMVFNKSINNDVNMRYFEAMGEGAVLLTDKAINNGVEELFQKNVHYLEYDSATELIDLIKRLKNDKNNLIEIGKKAKENVLTFHTYSNRAETILNIIPKIDKVVAYSGVYYIETFYRLNIFSECISSILSVFRNKKSGTFNKILNLLITVNLVFILNIIRLLYFFKNLVLKFTK